MKEEILLSLIKTVAQINGIIKNLESLGLQVEPDAFDGNLYGALDSTINSISNFIGFGSVEYWSTSCESSYMHVIYVTEETICSVYSELLQVMEENK